jgi:two-component system NtrC family response regulator
VRCLEQYAWPGNVRELKNIIHRAVLMAQGSVLTAALLPERIRNAPEAEAVPPPEMVRQDMTLSAAEYECITTALASTEGNKQAAARLLGISRRALYNKLKRYGLQ